MLFRDTGLAVTHFTTGQQLAERRCGVHGWDTTLLLLARFPTAVVGVQVARPTDHKSLTPPRCHDLYPTWAFPVGLSRSGREGRGRGGLRCPLLSRTSRIRPLGAV